VRYVAELAAVENRLLGSGAGIIWWGAETRKLPESMKQGSARHHSSFNCAPINPLACQAVMVKVKICGITNLKDALTAIAHGADAVGFLVGQVHYSTGVFITPRQAAEIVAALPPFCSTVLVTHLARPEEVVNAARIANVSTIQLHGDSSAAEAARIKEELSYTKIYKAVHVLEDAAIAEAQKYVGSVDGFVLDTAIRETGQIGGTGKTHDWRISRRIVESVPEPVILAGGLNPDNVVEAIRTVRPYAVDVNSGVSNRDGSKDVHKLKAFIERAKDLRIH
jgi:phosphoribosylanthranilate isomerase